jgi:hypothetical protein
VYLRAGTSTAQDPARALHVATLPEEEFPQHFRCRIHTVVQHQRAFKGRLNLVVASGPQTGCREVEKHLRISGIVLRGTLVYEDSLVISQLTPIHRTERNENFSTLRRQGLSAVEMLQGAWVIRASPEVAVSERQMCFH